MFGSLLSARVSLMFCRSEHAEFLFFSRHITYAGEYTCPVQCAVQSLYSCTPAHSTPGLVSVETPSREERSTARSRLALWLLYYFCDRHSRHDVVIRRENWQQSKHWNVFRGRKYFTTLNTVSIVSRTEVVIENSLKFWRDSVMFLSCYGEQSSEFSLIIVKIKTNYCRVYCEE